MKNKGFFKRLIEKIAKENEKNFGVRRLYSSWYRGGKKWTIKSKGWLVQVVH